MMHWGIKILLIVLLWAAVGLAEEKADFVYDDHGKRDPFWKLVSPGGSILTYETDLLISEMTLEGIIFDPSGKSLAIINGNVIEEKGKVGLYIISKIEENKVFLIKGNDIFTLELKKEE